MQPATVHYHPRLVLWTSTRAAGKAEVEFTHYRNLFDVAHGQKCSTFLLDTLSRTRVTIPSGTGLGMYTRNNGITPGAIIKVWLPRLGVYHVGILDWTLQVIHNSKDYRGVVVSSLADFTEGQLVSVVWAPQNDWQRATIIARAQQAIGRVKFRLLDSNCEDFVNWALTGVARSEQRNAIVLAVLLTIVTGMTLASLARR